MSSRSKTVATKAKKTALAPKLKKNIKNNQNAHRGNKRPATAIQTIIRPWTQRQYVEVSNDDCEIILDRIQKEIVNPCVAHPSIQPFVVRGVNSVSRLLQQRELQVVVMASNSSSVSSEVFGHIPLICRLHKVPICVLNVTSKTLGDVFKLHSLSVFGIKQIAKQCIALNKLNEHIESDGVKEDTNAAPAIDLERILSITEYLISKASKRCSTV